MIVLGKISFNEQVLLAVQNRSRFKNKCNPNDMKQNIERQARHSSNTIVSSSTTSDGHCRLKDNVWWYCEYGKLRGPVIKGYSRRIKYKWKILNDNRCKHDGQRVSVVRDGKSCYCVIL